MPIKTLCFAHNSLKRIHFVFLQINLEEQGMLPPNKEIMWLLKNYNLISTYSGLKQSHIKVMILSFGFIHPHSVPQYKLPTAVSLFSKAFMLCSCLQIMTSAEALILMAIITTAKQKLKDFAFMDITGLDVDLMYCVQFKFLGPAHSSCPGKEFVR